MIPDRYSNVDTRKRSVLVNLDAGHKELCESLEKLDPEEAFLGTRWSVWDIIRHLDSEGFVDTLESLSYGPTHMFPPFNNRAEKLRSDIGHANETFTRFRNLVENLTESQLLQEATPENQSNSFPKLNILELLERLSNHESNHAKQIVKTREYVRAFNSKDNAITIIKLDSDQPDFIDGIILGLLKYADYIAATDLTIASLHGKFTGVPLTLTEDNLEEVSSRLGSEAKSGLWVIICVSSNPTTLESKFIRLAEKHYNNITIRKATRRS
jgi:hypothetical protein